MKPCIREVGVDAIKLALSFQISPRKLAVQRNDGSTSEARQYHCATCRWMGCAENSENSRHEFKNCQMTATGVGGTMDRQRSGRPRLAVTRSNH
ncbi:unnamed protein product [Cylicostephanus goldi]|uniref:Uncharacterized protein n=1 Tax=Cylicostephanus goldi TaxID=71465 RepID=A0A3P6QNJ1_CYLGO|nr:unnamed protein product [Cylicostephanus goldi]